MDNSGREPLPWYKWYPKDFRASRHVQRMSYVERGLYRELLEENYLKGSIPDDISELADICSCPVEVMEKAWERLCRCFNVVEDGKRSNDRVDSVLSDQGRTRENNARAGKASAAARGNGRQGEQSPSADESIQRPSTPVERPLTPVERPLTPVNEEKRREERRREDTEKTLVLTGEPVRTAEEERLADSRVRPLFTKKGSKGSDPRHAACKSVLDSFWARHNTLPMPWSGKEAKHLSSVLSANPSLSVEQFEQILENRSASEVNHSEGPGIFLLNITKYANGPLDRYGKPLGRSARLSNGEQHIAVLQNYFRESSRRPDDGPINSDDVAPALGSKRTTERPASAPMRGFLGPARTGSSVVHPKTS